MTSKVHPAAGARMVTGIVSSIALVGMVSGFAYSGKIEEAKAELMAAKAATNAQAAAGVEAFVAAEKAKVEAAKAAKAAKIAQARRAAATIARSTVIPAAPSGSAAAPAPAPARPPTTAPAPTPAQPTVPVGGTSGGSQP